jgi:exopolysaccharide production protein ExoQ
MSSNIATVVYVLLILTLFLLERDRTSKVSSAVWIPVLWLSLGASRSVSQWIWGVDYTDSVDQYTQGSPLDALIYTGLMAAGMAVLLSRRERTATFLRSNGPLLLFFIYCGVSVLWSDYSFISFKRWIKSIGDLMMVLVVLTEHEENRAVNRLFTWPGFVLIPLSILLIKYYPHLGRGYSPWTGEAYNIGVNTQKNGLGYICLLFGLGSFWYLLEALRGVDRPSTARPLIAHCAILAMALWLFSMANSATSFFCFLIGGCLMVVTGMRTIARNPAILHLLVVLLLFIILYGLILNPKVGLTHVAGRDATLTGRTAIWHQVYQMNDSPWFGVGYDTFWLGPRLEEFSKSLNMHVNQAHNGYLEVYLDLGWVGVTLLGAIMVWGYRNINRVLRLDSEAGRIKLVLFVVTAVYNMTEDAFRELHPVWIAFLFAVIAIPEDPKRESAGDPKMLNSRLPRERVRLTDNLDVPHLHV